MEYEYRAVGEYLIVEKLSWLKTKIELPDSMKSDEGIVRGEILAIGNQEKSYADFYEDYNDVEKGILNVNDIILYDARVGLEINGTGNYLIRFANILAIELDEEPVKIKKLSRSVKEAKKKKPRKKKKAGKKRATTFRGRE